MKRTKQRTFGSDQAGGGEDNYFAKAPAPPEPVWAEVVAQPDEAFAAYSMATKFAKGAYVLHPKFGKGVVVDVEPTRVEILFEAGKKKLGHSA